jgi:hypothetical protein
MYRFVVFDSLKVSAESPRQPLFHALIRDCRRRRNPAAAESTLLPPDQKEGMITVYARVAEWQTLRT